ncbi:MAG TPA: ABC transporter transmembrane domain-containing protein [Xanthobacteraceae bacterium]|nr:ABC transporter transmembrane domain-containing protein [Xanthobacteraceae bacterium]
MTQATGENAANAETAVKAARGLRPLLALVPFGLRYRGRILAALGALVLASAATLVVPIAVRRMIDFGFAPENAGSIERYFEAMLVVAAVLAGASALRYYLVITLGERVVADLRAALFAHVMELSPAFYDRERVGEIASRLTADTTQIKAAFGSSASIALRNFVLFLGAAAMMAVTSPHLSALVLIAIPLIVLPLVAFGRMVTRRARAAQDTLADATAFAVEAIGAARAIQALTGESAASARFAAAVEHSFIAALRSTKARAWLTAATIFLVFASIVVILWTGAQNVLAGKMTAGTLSQFVLYAVFAAGALSELSQVWNELNQAAGAAGRIAELLQIEPEIRAPAKPVPLPQPARGEIRFEAVSFAYPARPEVRVLDSISFAVSPGERVAVVGPSGVGKSTLFHLLLRFYDPLAGKIRLDGVELSQADPHAVRRALALVPQDVAIFAMSIAENIRLGRPEASDAEVEAAARLALVEEFVSALPEKYRTEIGERGVTLSGGQRQRIVIARAILRNAPVLLLDEATSALDAESETLVQEALRRSMEGRTSLVIAHRLATVLGADRILVLDHGRLVEEGSHASLLAKGGLYARFAELQFGAAA